jgi:hypothetical protein
MNFRVSMDTQAVSPNNAAKTTIPVGNKREDIQSMVP